MENIKPIETVYKGYKFRSRLEARWAVFFDSLGIKYLYENEGYYFDDPDDIKGIIAQKPRQICYLPDFYLPELNIHVEVKGCDNALENDSHKIKCALETGGPLDQGLVILGNIPDPSEIKWGNLPLFSFLYPHEGLIIHELGTFAMNCRHEFIFVKRNLLTFIYGINNCKAQSYYNVVNNCLPEYTSTATRWSRQQLTSFDKDGIYIRPLVDAYTKARQARFEHGEKGE